MAFIIVKQVSMQSDGIIPWWNNISFHFSSNNQASIPIAVKTSLNKIHSNSYGWNCTYRACACACACKPNGIGLSCIREFTARWWHEYVMRCIIFQEWFTLHILPSNSMPHDDGCITKVMSIWMEHIFGFLHQIVHQTPFILNQHCCVRAAECACVLSHCSR